MHVRICSSIAGVCHLCAGSNLLPSCDNQTCLQTLCNVPWKAKSPPDENHKYRIKCIHLNIKVREIFF